MDNDPETITSCKGEQEEERQNRRQFFNGLGKWSLAIIAAVTALRDGLHDLESGIGSRFGTGSEGAGDLHQQIAKKKVPHNNGYHGDDGHIDRPHLEHADSARIQPGGGQPSGQPPTKVLE
jgi:hypothetical protein